MNRKCMFSSTFWEDQWIAELDPTEKFFYIYLFTNPNSNMLGYFSLPKRRICYDTGLNIEIVESILEKFQNVHKKIIYDHEWIFVKNTVKFQTLNNIKVRKGIVRMISEIQNTEIKMTIIRTFHEMHLTDFVNYICKQLDIKLSDIDSTCIGHTLDMDDTSIGDACDIDSTCIGHEQNGYILNTLPNTLLKEKQQQVVVKSDDSSGDDSSVVVVDFSEDEKHEFPPLPAKQKHFEKITHSFQVIREMAENKISPELILSIYNKNPILDLTRWWLWAKIKSKSNVPGFFLTLVNKAADEMPKDVAEQIKQEFLEIDQREKLIAERKRRVS